MDCRRGRGSAALSIQWTFAAIAIIVVGLRLFTRVHQRRNAGWDDLAAAAALAAILAGGVPFTLMVESGMGMHVDCHPRADLERSFEYWAICCVLHFLSTGLVKISVILALLRIIGYAREKTSRFLWLLLATIGITHSGLAVFLSAACHPFAKAWYPDLPGSCPSLRALRLTTFAGFGFDVLTDLICAVVPLIILVKVQMRSRTKIGLCFLMGLGVLTAGVGIASLTAIKVAGSQDWSYDAIIPTTLSSAEPTIGLILSCLAPLRSMLFGGRRRSHGNTGPYEGPRKRFINPQTDKRLQIALPRLKTSNYGSITSPSISEPEGGDLLQRNLELSAEVQRPRPSVAPPKMHFVHYQVHGRPYGFEACLKQHHDLRAWQ